MATARYYDEAKDDGSQHIYGVPKRDLTEEEYKALKPWVKAQVDDAPYYRKTNPTPEPKAANKPGGDKATGEEK